MRFFTFEERKNFKPKSWKLKPFDLKKINDIKQIHPFHYIMRIIFKYYPYYDEDDTYLYDDPDEEDLLNSLEYFEMLDNFNRYGIGFNPDDMLRRGNELHVQNFDDNKDEYYVIDRDWWRLEELIFNNVKVIKLHDIDTGEKELSEIEKWKRRVVNRQKSVKNKLTLINPDIYNNFLLFYKLSKSDKIIQ